MTQPIQEPTTPRAVSRLTWGENQLFRRPGPQVGIATTSAYFDGFRSNGTGFNVANDSWEQVTTGVDLANSRWFDEFNYDPAGDWSADFDAGAILDNPPFLHLYTAWGFVVFDVPDGTLIGAAIEWDPSEFQANTDTVVDGLQRVEVSAERSMTLGGVKLHCYQASGGAAELLEARLHVRRFEQYEDVYIQEFATS